MSQVYLRLNAADTFRKMVTDAENEVRWSFTFDNLENPTQYVSEHAVRLRLPVCPENNKFFGQFLRLDSTIAANGYTPTEKMQYIAMDDGAVVSTGTAVIETIDRQYYNLSLVGSQATLFRKLMNAGYDTAKAAEDNTYFLMTDWLKCRKIGSLVIDEQTNVLNQFQVMASWLIDNPLTTLNAVRTANLLSTYGITERNITETMAFIASIVGFAPVAQGMYEEFESDTWLENPDSGQTAGFYMYLPVLNSVVDMHTLEPIERVKVTDGVVDAQMGEYRSYYQQPFVYVKMLWELFAFEFAQITGYSIALDSRWYNDSDLGKLVYFLPLNDMEEKVVSTQQLGSASETKELPSREADFGCDFEASISGPDLLEYMVNTYDVVVILDIAFPGLGAKEYVNIQRPIEVTVDAGGVFGNSFVVFPLPADGIFSESDIKNDTIASAILKDARMNMKEVIFPVYYAETDKITIEMRLPLRGVPTSSTPADVHISLNFFGNTASPFVFNDRSTAYSSGIFASFEANGVETTKTNARSNSVITLERLFGNISPFQILLQYSKQRHLYWHVDDGNKTVSVITASDYFSDLGGASTDLTDYCDGDILTSPLSWSEHAVVFNLGEMVGDGVNGYNDRYGLTYGSKKVVTENNLSTNSKDFFDGISIVTGSAMYSAKLAPCAVLQGGVGNLYVDSMPAPLNVSEGKPAGNYGNFYYRKDNVVPSGMLLARWTDDDEGQYLWLTDDAPTEVLTGRFTWHGQHIHEEMLGETRDEKVRVLPAFSTCSGNGQSVLFAPVREVYTSQPDTPTNYLYEQHWQHYIEEVYNPENKTIDCKIFFTRRLLEAVRKNPVVRIGNLLYLVMSIEGWSSHTRLCRCKLRQINDINNLRI